MKQKIIIDTDCGSDDAMAIAMSMNANVFYSCRECNVESSNG